ncbi:MAG: hypothetical protein HND57_04045 [Planctomycetes bacterium]|nr:hypothetical protein [Planctomycetota bacterium]
MNLTIKIIRVTAAVIFVMTFITSNYTSNSVYKWASRPIGGIRQVELHVGDGEIDILWTRARSANPNAWYVTPARLTVHFVHHRVRGIRKPVFRLSHPGWTLTLPFWLIILVSGAAAFALSISDLRRHLRSAQGKCPRCGYDLRGNRDDESGCPECGYGREKDE